MKPARGYEIGQRTEAPEAAVPTAIHAITMERRQGRPPNCGLRVVIGRLIVCQKLLEYRA